MVRKPLTRVGSVGCNPMILKVTTSGNLIASESRVQNLRVNNPKKRNSWVTAAAVLYRSYVWKNSTIDRSTQLNSIENQSKTDAAQVESKGGIEDSEKDREMKSVEWSDKTMELINAATLLPVRYLDTSRRNAIDMCIHIVIIIIIMGFCIYSETKSLSFGVVVCRRSRRAMSLRIVQVPTSFCLSLSPSLSLI